MGRNDVGKSIIVNRIAMMYFEGRERDETKVFTILLHTVIVFHTFMPVSKHMIWYSLVQNIETIGVMSCVATINISLFCYTIVDGKSSCTGNGLSQLTKLISIPLGINPVLFLLPK